MSEEPNVASDYYPRYIDDNASIVLDIGGGEMVWRLLILLKVIVGQMYM